MSDDLHGTEILDKAELEAALAHEGVQAFAAMTTGPWRALVAAWWRSTPPWVPRSGGQRVAAAAEIAAQNAKQAAAEAHASVCEERRSLALWAERLALSPRRAAWYPKPAATFADALARMRQHLWLERVVTSADGGDMTEPISPGLQRIVEAACYGS